MVSRALNCDLGEAQGKFLSHFSLLLHALQSMASNLVPRKFLFLSKQLQGAEASSRSQHCLDNKRTVFFRGKLDGRI